MTREELQNKIIEKCKEIAEILKQYDEDADYLTITIRIKENACHFNNKYWDENEKNPIDFMDFDFMKL